MFKLPNGIPSLRSSSQEWADYAEYLALTNGQISLYEVVRAPLLVSDETVVSGVIDQSDRFNDKADEITIEINRRINLCGDRYPFRALQNGYIIQYNSADMDSDWVYRFLLLSTRLHMTRNKVQNGIDGTQLFEHLSAIVAKQFFGDNSEVDVLGTSRANGVSFRQKLTELVTRMGEGESIHQNPNYRPQDDGVDVVLWKGFSDNQPSKIIAFGQCKTGTNWSDKLSELNTESFCTTWFTRRPVVLPLRMFFCAQYFPIEIWIPRANTAGLVFDRFRILDYLPAAINTDLMANIRTWVSAALN